MNKFTLKYIINTTIKFNTTSSILPDILLEKQRLMSAEYQRFDEQSPMLSSIVPNTPISKYNLVISCYNKDANRVAN